MASHLDLLGSGLLGSGGNPQAAAVLGGPATALDAFDAIDQQRGPGLVHGQAHTRINGRSLSLPCCCHCGAAYRGSIQAAQVRAACSAVARAAVPKLQLTACCRTATATHERHLILPPSLSSRLLGRRATEGEEEARPDDLCAEQRSEASLF